MHRTERYLVSLLTVALLSAAAPAATPADPLRCLPADVDLVLSIPRPADVVSTIQNLEVVRNLYRFSAYRELLESTNVRHLEQFVAYFEKETGSTRSQILDDISGGGVVLGLKLGKEPGPALMILQGRDDKRVGEFARLAFHLLEQEVLRSDDKTKVVHDKYRDIQTISVDDKFFLAVAGSAILLGNQQKILHSSIDLYRKQPGKSCADLAAMADAAKFLPSRALATLWLNLEEIKKYPNAANAFRSAPRNEPAQTVLFGGYLDVIGRSPFVAAALVREGDDVLLTVRMPKGRKGMGADSGLHVPPLDDGHCRPLLVPAGTVFSTRFYLDAARIWQDRDKLFTDQVARAIETADKGTNPVLSAFKTSKLLPELGAHHRVVVRVQLAPPFKDESERVFPAFAAVSEMREPDLFAKTMEGGLRAAALFAGLKVRLKLVTEEVGDVKLVGYRFDADQPGLDEGFDKTLRFFSPCFARIGDQFMISSTLELGRELIASIRDEKSCTSANAITSRVFATGVADFLRLVEDQIVTQLVLDQALTGADAAAETKQLLTLLRSISPLNIEVRYDNDRFRYDFRFRGLK